MAAITTFCLSLGMFSGILKPSLVSVDMGTLQVGSGIVVHYPMEGMATFLIPDLGLSIGQARVYWGKKVAFVAGLELFRGELAYAPSGRTVIFGTFELLMPEIGLSTKLGPIREPNSKSCINPNECESFIPRLEFLCGFCPTTLLISTGAMTLRTEAKIFVTRSVQVLFENRNVWSDYSVNNWYKMNTFSLALCFAFGHDFPAGNKGGE